MQSRARVARPKTALCAVCWGILGIFPIAAFAESSAAPTRIFAANVTPEVAPRTPASVVPARGVSRWGIVIDDSDGQGVAVTAVSGFSPAAEAGILPGDVLLAINGVSVRSAQAFREI